jgi:hypothetical protein
LRFDFLYRRTSLPNSLMAANQAAITGGAVCGQEGQWNRKTRGTRKGGGAL